MTVALDEVLGCIVRAVEPERLMGACLAAWGGDALRDAVAGALGTRPVRVTPWWFDRIAHYSQRDALWAGDKLGYSATLTLGKAGCAVTASAMLCSLVDPAVTPGTLNAKLKLIGGFANADLIWQQVPNACAKLRYVGRKDWNRPCTDAEVAYVRDALDRYGPQVIEVDFDPATRAQEQHFVVGLFIQDGDLRIIDPWTGEEGWLLQDYATDKQTLRDALWGIRVYAYDRVGDGTP